MELTDTFENYLNEYNDEEMISLLMELEVKNMIVYSITWPWYVEKCVNKRYFTTAYYILKKINPPDIVKIKGQLMNDSYENRRWGLDYYDSPIEHITALTTTLDDFDIIYDTEYVDKCVFSVNSILYERKKESRNESWDELGNELWNESWDIATECITKLKDQFFF